MLSLDDNLIVLLLSFASHFPLKIYQFYNLFDNYLRAVKLIHVKDL